jgi:hypothetical protein
MAWRNEPGRCPSSDMRRSSQLELDGSENLHTDVSREQVTGSWVNTPLYWACVLPVNRDNQTIRQTDKQL